MCIYTHCFPSMLLVLAMKCSTKMPCPLPHNHYCCLLFLHIYACLTCSSVHASSLYPLLAHHRLCYVDLLWVSFIFFFGTTSLVFFYFCIIWPFSLILYSYWMCIIYVWMLMIWPRNLNLFFLSYVYCRKKKVC